MAAVAADYGLQLDVTKAMLHGQFSAIRCTWIESWTADESVEIAVFDNGSYITLGKYYVVANHARKEIVFEGNCEEIMRVDNGPNGQLRVRVRLVNEQGDSRIQEISSVSHFNREVIDGYRK